MILAALACPVFTSCYDDSALNDRIDGIEEELGSLEERVAALEKRLNEEVAALQTLIESKIAALKGEMDALVTVSKCEKQNDGSYQITLSDGTGFTVYPEYVPEAPDHTGLVTTTELGGVLYWAVYEDGKPVVVTDSEGNPVPVVDVVPQVRVDAETGLVEISFDGGNEWIAVGYNTPSIFADAEVVYTDMYSEEDEINYPEFYQEQPMYVVLTLADGSQITVSIDGVASFQFASNYGGPISKQYIGYGSTTAIPVQAMNVVEWIKEVPAGWQVKEDTQYLAEYGQAEFHVTAPTAEAIASGAAVAEGTLKVLAVAEGGKSVTASVKLTTKAFGNVAAGAGKLTVEMNNGVGGYLVGVSTLAEFDAEAILAELKPIIEYVPDPNDWMDYGWSPWYVDETETPYDDNYFDRTIEDYPIASLKHADNLVEGEQYVVWVLPLESWIDNATWQSGYYVGSITSIQYFNAFINLDEANTVVSFNDIQIQAEFKGVTAYYGSFNMLYSDELNKEGILAEFNSGLTSSWGAPQLFMVNDEYVEGWENGVFTGSPNDLVQGWQSITPGERYYLYLIPYVEGKTKYTLSEVYFYEWETEPLMSGGTVNVTAAEPTLEHKTISVPLTAEGAVYIYYKFIEPAMVPTIEDKQAYLLENGAMTEGGAYTASQYNLSPNKTMTLLAMAVDQYGCYGDVFQQDYTTKTMEYASAVVTAELQGTPDMNGLIKLACDGDVDTYYYWYGAADNYQWTNSSYLGGTAESASAFIALTPNSYLLKKVKPADLPEAGIELTNLTVGTPCVFVASAKLTDGTFTAATLVNFTPEMNLGNFVYATDDNGAENPVWAAAKPNVTYNVEQIGDFTTVTWSVELPEGFTGKTACFSEDYLINYPSAKNKVQYIYTDEYVYSNEIVAGATYVNNYASKGYNIYTVICDSEGNFYETYVTKLDISGGFGV